MKRYAVCWCVFDESIWDSRMSLKEFPDEGSAKAYIADMMSEYDSDPLSYETSVTNSGKDLFVEERSLFGGIRAKMFELGSSEVGLPTDRIGDEFAPLGPAAIEAADALFDVGGEIVWIAWNGKFEGECLAIKYIDDSTGRIECRAVSASDLPKGAIERIVEASVAESRRVEEMFASSAKRGAEKSDS